jgi:uncharacterized membrane protein (UPF0127 family)
MRRLLDSWPFVVASVLAVTTILAPLGCGSEPPATTPEAPPPPPATGEITTTPGTDRPPKTAISDLTPADADTLTVLRTSDAGMSVIAIEIAGERYEVELAIAARDRARGLGGRERFPSGTGMLFVHSDDQHRRYWMKDCLVDMDIAFVDRQGRIVAMHRMPTEPPRGSNESISAYQSRLPGYPSRRPARYALEVPPGDLERLGLRLGDTLPIPRAPLDALAAREVLGTRRR